MKEEAYQKLQTQLTMKYQLNWRHVDTTYAARVPIFVFMSRGKWNIGRPRNRY
jgi:hypothetical protein